MYGVGDELREPSMQRVDVSVGVTLGRRAWRTKPFTWDGRTAASGIVAEVLGDDRADGCTRAFTDDGRGRHSPSATVADHSGTVARAEAGGDARPRHEGGRLLVEPRLRVDPFRVEVPRVFLAGVVPVAGAPDSLAR